MAALLLAARPVGAQLPPDGPLLTTRVTHDGHLKRGPVWWPGTRWLVYSSEHAETGGLLLMKFNLDSNQIERVLDGGKHSTREFSASSDGKVYAYNTVSGLSSKITVVDGRRGTTTVLPSMGRASWANWADVSPDGHRVLFVEGAHTIYEYDLREDKGKASVRAIQQNPEHISDYWPRYRSDGQRIVFASNRDGDYEVYTMNTYGGDVRRVTRSPGLELHPAYSHDGQQIAFTSNRDGNFEIYVSAADGSRSRRITYHEERDDYASWLPDDSGLVFIREQDGQFDLHTVAFNQQRIQASRETQ